MSSFTNMEDFIAASIRLPEKVYKAYTTLRNYLIGE